MVLGLLIGVSLGAVAALRTGRPLDYIVRVLAVLGLAVPGFWVALMVLTFLARSFNWIPPLQYQSLFSHPMANIQMLGIPVIILGFNLSAVIMRLTRGSLLEVFRQDYIRTARAKGLSQATLVNRHALRNALIPVITVIGVQLGFLLGGVVVLEQIFSIPGLGNFTFQAINTRDYPAIQAAVLFIAVAFVLVNLLVDLAYVVVDPRVSLT
jgi:peptide/nickel transport system permease protein